MDFGALNAWKAGLSELHLPDHARVWMYTASRDLSEGECRAVEETMAAFVKGWEAHGKALNAQSQLMNGQILILALDESHQPATGCSIDASVAAIRSLSELLPDADWLNRGWVLHEPLPPHAPGDKWQRSILHDFWAMCKANNVPADTQVVDSTVATLGDVKGRGVVPLSDSWHASMW